jgi:hypothetical protein
MTDFSVDGMYQARRNTKPWGRRFEASKQLARRIDPRWQTREILGHTVDFEQPRRHAPEAGRGAGKAPPWRPTGATLYCQSKSPLWLIATGKPLPATETAISV